MKRAIWLVPAVLCMLFSTTARAQDAPEWELFGGYSYVKNVRGSGSRFHMEGGVGSLTQNLNGWFGGRVQTGFFTGNEAGRNINAQTVTYGPVFSTHKYERMIPYINVQLGAIHASRGYLGISAPAWKFAMAPGVGVDFAINERAAIRVQADYLMTRFLSRRQDNLQGTVGLVVRFGRK
jgi:hypothetical protein